MGPNEFLRLAEQLPDALLMLSREGEILAVNRAATDMLEASRDDLVGREVHALLENDFEDVQRHLRYWARSTQPVPAPLTWRGLAGAEPPRCFGFLLRPESRRTTPRIAVRCEASAPPVSTFMALNRELEKQRRALRQLQKSRSALALEHEKATVTLSSIGDAVVTTDREGRVEYLNPVAEGLTGWAVDEAAGQPLNDVFRIINEYTRTPAPDPVSRCLEDGQITGLANHTALIARDGTEYVIEDSAAPIRSPKGKVYGAVLVFRDVTSERVAERQLEYLAQHDALTGLWNRHYFERQLEQAVHGRQRGETPHAMLYIDLDEFKVVNDTAGHSVGDTLLTEVAYLLARRVREGDVLARLGGDEFGVLLYDIDEADALKVADVLVRAMDEFRFEHSDNEYRVGASIGVATIDHATASPGEVMKKADIASYVAKRQGGRRANVYTPEADTALGNLGEIGLVGELKEALAQDRFELHYQPIVSLPQKEIALYEVLVRLNDRDGNQVLPSLFLPVAKTYGLMRLVDRYVVASAIDVLGRAHARGDPMRLSVNLSGSSLGDPELLGVLQEMLAPLKLPAGALVFEITETEAVAHIKRAHDFMHSLKALGCQFALDDFGIGFSSFAYLKHLPVDYIKIDGTFVRDIIMDPVDQEVVRSINQIAHSLGKQTVAEYVESAEILGQIEAFGVDMAQGYHIGRPAPL